ncbi:MAG: aminotransferase class I/II-fold pyridoxal phosphate-dependent enzyme, partial [bacterium]
MLSQRVQGIGFSATLRIGARAQKMMAEGKPIIDLSVGEPDFPTPHHIKEAAKRALDREATKYTENEGILALREAISQKYRQEWGADYRPEEVIVSTGAKQCLYNALMSLVGEGDEVIIPSPYWVSYTHMVKLAKGVPVIVKTRQEEGFRLTSRDLALHITPRTKVLLLNNPSNPTGTAYGVEHLRPLIDICLDEGIFIISDEIYEKLIYDGFLFQSIAGLGERVRRQAVIVNGFSKSY